MKKQILKISLSLLVGAFFIWLSAKDWPSDLFAGAWHLDGSVLHIGNHISSDLLWFFPYLLALTMIHVLRVIRWKPLLDPMIPLSLKEHNRIGAVGFMAMFLFPLRIGEFVRPHLVKILAKKRGIHINRSQILSTVVVERITDGVVVSLVLFFTLFLIPGQAEQQQSLKIGAYSALAIFLAASLLVLGARFYRKATKFLMAHTLGLLSKRVESAISRMLDDFIDGLERLPGVLEWLYFLALTLIYWFLNGIGVWFMLQAFGLPVDMLGAFAMMSVAVVGMMIPNSPGNIGSFWYFLCLPATLYGLSLSDPQVVAFGLSVWLMQLLQQSLFGLWFVFKKEVSWEGIMEATYEEEAPSQEAAPHQP